MVQSVCIKEIWNTPLPPSMDRLGNMRGKGGQVPHEVGGIQIDTRMDGKTEAGGPWVGRKAHQREVATQEGLRTEARKKSREECRKGSEIHHVPNNNRVTSTAYVLQLPVSALCR